MPEVDGLELVTQFRAQDFTREIPMIVLSTKEEATTKAKAFAVGANDYLVKLPDRIELLARIRYHSKGYINLLQRNEAYRALAESQTASGQRSRQCGGIRAIVAACQNPGRARKRRLAVHFVHRPIGRHVRLSLARRTTFLLFISSMSSGTAWRRHCFPCRC